LSYVSIHKSQLLDSLENQVLYADLTSVIIGSKGFGKSFLLKELHSRLDGQVYISQIEADSVMTPAQLDKSISLQLGLSWQENGQSLLDKISESLEQRILLTVDDAHLLSLYCLDYLLGLMSQLNEQQNLFFIVLAGEATLAKKLNATPKLKSNPNLCVVFELQPFEESETKLLISDFNATTENKIDKLFDTQKISYFWQLSHGNPAELSDLLMRWKLETNSQLSSEQLDNENQRPKRQIILSVVYSIFALILVFALIYQDDINKALEPDIAKELKPDRANSKLKLRSKSSAELGLSELASAKKKTEQNNKTGLTEVEQLTSTDKKELKVTNNPVEKVIADDAYVQELEKLELIERELAAQKLTENSVQEKIKLKSKNVVNTHRNQSEDVSVVDKNSLLTNDENKLLKINSQYYTLQWMGVSSLESAEVFKKKHPQKDHMLIFRRKLGDKFLFVLVSGQFESRVTAENSKTIYKKQGYPGNPWVKSIKAVQTEINEHNNS
jgi:type II secretory pathway predicted ATPase ExeA/septal ring-binding cell division protein DamX